MLLLPRAIDWRTASMSQAFAYVYTEAKLRRRAIPRGERPPAKVSNAEVIGWLDFTVDWLASIPPSGDHDQPDWPWKVMVYCQVMERALSDRDGMNVMMLVYVIRHVMIANEHRLGTLGSADWMLGKRVEWLAMAGRLVVELGDRDYRAGRVPHKWEELLYDMESGLPNEWPHSWAKKGWPAAANFYPRPVSSQAPAPSAL
jgi:hypothetical protein